MKNKTNKQTKTATKATQTIVKQGNISLLDLVAKALTYKYNDDPTAPSVIVSQLKNGDWYSSAVRYLKPFGGERKVVFKAQGDTSTEALRNLAQQITQDGKQINPIDQLRSVVSN
jgi:hypothetical protein